MSPGLVAQGEVLPFNLWELLFVGLYLTSLILIGALGYRARKSTTLQDFYLAGKGVGFIVLVLTLYATQYSGNTLFAFSGKTYRMGLPWIMCLHFMTAIVVCYLLFAPRLFQLAKRHTFITPPDFVQHRFGSRLLTTLVSIIMIIAIANFLVAQLMAMGRALQGITDWDDQTAYSIGVVVLALIVVIYETLGGFRAVAWTDMIQGGVLMIGFILLMFIVVEHYGPFEKAAETIAERTEGENTLQKIDMPDDNTMRQWYSYILIVGLGGALYPQAIQRIYAARSWNTLRTSLATMAFLPLMTTVVVVLVGFYAIAYHPEIQTAKSDTVLTVVCGEIQQSSLFGRVIICVLFAAILAALMSTADSVLLAISSMFTKDIYGVWIRPNSSEHHLTNVGKGFSWIVITIAVTIALCLYRGQTLVQLLDKKFDLLVQLVPAFMLGCRFKRLSTRSIASGLIVGICTALAIGFGSQTSKLWGIHAGLYGLSANMLVIAAVELIAPSKHLKPLPE